MALVYEWGFFVKEDRKPEFLTWLREHEEELARHAPEHLEYLGTYTPVWAPEERCDFYQLWRWRSHIPSFSLREVARTESSAFTELARQFLSFVDDDRSSQESFRLHRSAVVT
ncbi:MAG: hypothetical protein KatS3mg011_0063 [Acidimicrobiia bacterium]|nr:MAG: hypothetical protein KatS3mg011_0063 [Acidimicrobiia bacterium]